MGWLKNLFGQASEGGGFHLPRGTTSLIASPDSTRLAYAVQDSHGAHVGINGRNLHNYEAVSGITFSADSRRIAYAAMRKNRWFVVLDETEYEMWDDIGKTSPLISPDSNHIAYTAKRGGKWFAVLDGNIIGGPYEGFISGGIVFSPDSQRSVYAVRDGDYQFVVVDGKEQRAFHAIIHRSWTVSPNSKRLAYIAGIKGSWQGDAFIGEEAVVVDDEVQETWKSNGITKKDGLMEWISFSPDSMRLAYGVWENGKSFVVVDGVHQRKFNGIIAGWRGSPYWSKFPDYGKAFCKSDSVVFSRDSLHFAYAASDGNEALLIYDGEEKGRHQGIHNMPIVFSPDSKRVAYGAEKGSKQFLVVDWTPMEAHYGLPPIAPSFSPDSKYIAYVVTKRANDNEFWLIINSHSWLLHGGPVIGANLVWDDSNHLHTLVAKQQEVTVSKYEIV